MNSFGGLARSAFLIIIVFVAGCSTNQMTGRSQLLIVSEKSAITQATSAYTAMIGGLEKKGIVSKDETLVERVQSITDKLISQAVRYRPDTESWAWSVKVIDDPDTLNAFCMPGGKMAIYTGLITKLSATDDEIAQVMGHEISHAIANHGAEKMSNQILVNAVVAGVAAGAATPGDRQTRQNVGALVGMAFVTLPNSRTAEEEADRLGIELAARAGYDPAAAVSLWTKMMNQTGNKSKADFFSTHPSAPNRIASLQAMQRPMQPLYEHAKKETVAVRKWTSTAPNEVAVNESTAPSVSSSLAATSSQTAGQPLAFYSKEYEQFKSGEAELTCESCSMSFVLKQTSLREKYDQAAWRELAMDTLKVGYKLDLAYFYLGKAAMALGFPEAGKQYLDKAIAYSATKEWACSEGFLVKCGDIAVKPLATALLATQ